MPKSENFNVSESADTTCNCEGGFIRQYHSNDDAYEAQRCWNCLGLPERDDVTPDALEQMSALESLLLSKRNRSSLHKR